MPLNTLLTQRLFQSATSTDTGPPIAVPLIRDTSFNPTIFGVSGSAAQIVTIFADPNGKIYIGGSIATVNGNAYGNMAKLNNDGTRDTGFTTGTGFNSIVRKISKRTDGQFFVAGQFTTYLTTNTRNRIALVGNTGGVFAYPIGTGFSSLVQDIAHGTDNKVIAVGLFNTYANTTNVVPRVARLHANAALDTAFAVTTGLTGNTTFSGNVGNAVVLQSDNKVIVTGGFVAYNGTARNRIVRINTNGSVDTTFNVGTGLDNAGSVLHLQSDGKVLVGGGFTTYNGVSQNRLARLHANGSLDTTFNIGTGFAGGSVDTITTDPSGKILVGGEFTSYNGITQNRAVRLHANGMLDPTGFSSNGFNDGRVLCIVVQSDNKILVGGTFSSYEGVSTTARLMRFANN